MKLCEINPFIRYAAADLVNPITDFAYSYDSRLFYVLEGSGTLIINNEKHTLEPQDLAIWKCGNKYCLCDYYKLKL